MKHSQAPFSYVSSSCPNRAAIKDVHGSSIASLIGLSQPHEMDANGNLFAAAPLLLEALNQIVQLSTDTMNSQDSEFQRKANALIGNIALRAMAKAEGR